MVESTVKDGRLRIYDDDGDLLMQADRRAERVVLMPAGDPRQAAPSARIRIQWGQHLISDLLSRRYRTLVCGVNPEDNTHGIISQLAEMLPTSQWNTKSITHLAQLVSKSTAPSDVVVLKFDLDAVEILALLRPHGRDHFTLDDISKGFRKVSEMLEGRYDRLPCASVSFLGAKSNRLSGADGAEPAFESVLRAMYQAGYHGDVYPALRMWELAPTGVFASYPFPESLNRMRSGGF
jgi:hypothetical protein